MKMFDSCFKLVGKPFASKFIAGKDVYSAFKVVRELNWVGADGIINFLGEEVKDHLQVLDNFLLYKKIIEEGSLNHLKFRISVKPSQIGLSISDGLYMRNLVDIALFAGAWGVPMEVDMEEEDTASRIVTSTIRLRTDYYNIPVRQAVAVNMKHAFHYIMDLASIGVKVRLCKGAYASTYTSQVVVQDRFKQAAWRLLYHESDPDFATHDPNLITAFGNCILSHGFQFLLGLGEKYQKRLLGKECRVAIYVPFGENWMPYAKRRWKYFLGKMVKR